MVGGRVLRVWEHVVTILVIFHLGKLYRREGMMRVAQEVVQWLRAIPGVNPLLTAILRNEAKGAVKLLTKGKGAGGEKGKEKRREGLPIPDQGKSPDEVMRELLRMKHGAGAGAGAAPGKQQRQEESKEGEGEEEESEEAVIEQGKLFALVYTLVDDPSHGSLMSQAFKVFTDPTGVSPEHDHVLAQVYAQFAHGNALNPTAFPSLLRMETEVVSMAASMLNGDADVAGSLTSGGTESILMAMKTYRDLARARSPHIKHPEVIAPITVHPAFEKAAHYFDLKVVHIPLGPDYRPDMAKYREAITANTVLLVASAPQYCHGVVDPIEEISVLALKYGLPFHVDACFGGFMLPWVEKLGFKVPLFDFRVSGVTSISADLHKVGVPPLYSNLSIIFNFFLLFCFVFFFLFGSMATSTKAPV